MAVFELIVRTAIRGYHVYKQFWEPDLGEGFVCYKEVNNEHNRFATAIYTYEDAEDVRGHLPREISHITFFFLEHNGTITGKVTDKRRYYRERGGLEIPCELTFTGKKKHIAKLRTFLETHKFSCTSVV